MLSTFFLIFSKVTIDELYLNYPSYFGIMFKFSTEFSHLNIRENEGVLRSNSIKRN